MKKILLIVFIVGIIIVTLLTVEAGIIRDNSFKSGLIEKTIGFPKVYLQFGPFQAFQSSLAIRIVQDQLTNPDSDLSFHFLFKNGGHLTNAGKKDVQTALKGFSDEFAGCIALGKHGPFQPSSNRPGPGHKPPRSNIDFVMAILAQGGGKIYCSVDDGLSVGNGIGSLVSKEMKNSGADGAGAVDAINGYITFVLNRCRISWCNTEGITDAQKKLCGCDYQCSGLNPSGADYSKGSWDCVDDCNEFATSVGGSSCPIHGESTCDKEKCECKHPDCINQLLPNNQN